MDPKNFYNEKPKTGLEEKISEALNCLNIDADPEWNLMDLKRKAENKGGKGDAQCKFWMSGFCSRGNRCFYKHDKASFGIDSKTV